MLAKQPLPVDERILLQPGPAHGGTGPAVAEINPAIGIQGEIEKAALACGSEGGLARDDVALADEVASIGEKREPLRMAQFPRHRCQGQRPYREH